MTRSLARAVIVTTLCLDAASSFANDSAQEVTLEVGAQDVLDANDVGSYSEGIKGIADIRLTQDGRRFIIVGLRPGRTSLLVLTRDGDRRQYSIVVTGDTVVRSESGYGPGSVGLRSNIRLDVYFVRVSRSYRHRLGVAWPGSVGGGSLAFGADLRSGVITDATVVAEQALPRLDMAEGAGWAKLMHHSALITANGSEATFGGGGELNVPIAGSISADLRKITFGSTVRMRPRYDSESGRVELEVEAELSDLTDGGGSGVPGRATSQLQALVNLELGQALVLAGLQTSSERRGSDGLPGLSRIPLLGALFGSLSRQEEETESIVLIVPSAMDATEASDRARVRAALDAFERFDGDVDGGVVSQVEGER